MQNFLVQDVPVLLAGVLASIACAIVGSLLVLRRMSLMGDAISHAVLPGIVLAFLLSDSLAAGAMFLGAAAIGVITASLTHVIHRLGRVESGAAMGVVFTVLFAIGVLMLERTGGRSLHLDADCVLYGSMEGVLWTSAPTTLGGLFTAQAWNEFPRQIITLLITLAIDAAVIVLLFKEFRIASFDPGLAAAQGVHPGVMHFLLMVLTAMTTVAAFEAVGSILVVAMLIVPGLCARLLSNRLGTMMWLSVVIAALASGAGYGVAATVNVSAAGMIGVMLGVILAAIAAAARMMKRSNAHSSISPA